MWRQRWSKLWKEKSGITLVELIVAFALMGLFMTAASFVLTSSLRLFTRMQSVSSAVTVSDILLDKIAGEISAAKQPDLDPGGMVFKDRGYYVWLGKDGNMDFGSGSEWITMWNRSGSPLAIYAEPDGALCLRYYETVRGEVGAVITGDLKTVPEMNWHFDNGVYMGYRITEGGLTFSREDPENHPNVIRIDLEIHNDRTGFTYRSSRYAECYNYNYKLEQVKKYLGVRPDKFGMPEDTPPVKEKDFAITNDGSGGTGEPDPDEPTKYAYSVYYRTDPGNDADGWIKWIEDEAVDGTVIWVTEDLTPEEGMLKLPPLDIPGYVYDELASQSMITIGSLISKNNLYLRYNQKTIERVAFTVVSRAKQENGTYIQLQEKTCEEEVGSQFVLTPEELLEYNGKTYKCLSPGLNFTVTPDMEKIYYVEYKLFNEDEYFQGTIPLDPDGWWRTPDTPVNGENGDRQQVVNPSGIARWEESGTESFYYVVINQITGLGWNTQNPGYFNETYVIQIPDLAILNYEELVPSLRPEQGSEFHARVFSYKGNYYVRLGYKNPLGSPEEQASEWYKLP